MSPSKSTIGIVLDGARGGTETALGAWDPEGPLKMTCHFLFFEVTATFAWAVAG